MRAFLSASALSLILTLGLSAAAHGAFPEGRQLAADPTNPAHLWLRATYGVLVSSDAGANWRWICNIAPGYASTEEPVIAATPDGALLIATFDTIRKSPDQGCTWNVPPTAPSGANGMISDPQNPAHILTVTSRGIGNGSFQTTLAESKDSGETFSTVTTGFDSGALVLGLAAAPSKPTRLYLSGMFSDADAGGSPQGGVLRSDDSAQSYTHFEVPVDPGSPVYVLGVSPTDPDTVYVRTEALTADQDPVLQALWVSQNGGTSFQKVLEKHAVLYGFTFTPDGSSVLAGFGDPQGTTIVISDEMGLYGAPIGSASFSLVHPNHIGCLSYVGNDLYACLSQFSDQYELGRSSDGGKTFTGLLRLDTFQPADDCAPETTYGGVCPAEWTGHICRDLGRCDTPSDAGTGGSSASNDTGKKGCGCSMKRSSPESATLALAALALAILSRRRRR